jgi:hypothetical protein
MTPPKARMLNMGSRTLHHDPIVSLRERGVPTMDLAPLEDITDFFDDMAYANDSTPLWRSLRSFSYDDLIP